MDAILFRLVILHVVFSLLVKFVYSIAPGAVSARVSAVDISVICVGHITVAPQQQLSS